MAIVICVNAINVSDYASILIDGKNSALELVHEKISRMAKQLPSGVSVNGCFIFADKKLPAAVASSDWTCVVEEKWSPAQFFDCIIKNSSRADTLVFIRGDAPLINTDSILSMLKYHHDHVSEYTYADGYPLGITCEIIENAALPALKPLIKEGECVDADTKLFQFIERDINAFDVEVDLAPIDFRHLRIEFVCNTKNNFLLTKHFLKYSELSIEELLEKINHEKLALRQLPSFVSIEVVGRHSQEVTYSPYHLLVGNRNKKMDDMDVHAYADLVQKICAFAPEAALHISLWGEIALHQNLEQILDISLDSNLEIMLETSGVGWQDHHVQKLLDLPNLGKLKIIAALDSYDPESYHKIRGDGFQEAYDFVNKLIKKHPGSTYVQATRLKEYSDDLEKFYNHWIEITNNVIIQKYDNFCGRLPARKVVDVSPIHREPCWHIKRDLNVLIDGTVPLCREDIMLEHVLGNVFEQSLEDVWSQGQEYHQLHIKKDYPEICSSCDEHYTFNN